MFKICANRNRLFSLVFLLSGEVLHTAISLKEQFGPSSSNFDTEFELEFQYERCDTSPEFRTSIINLASVKLRNFGYEVVEGWAKNSYSNLAGKGSVQGGFYFNNVSTFPKGYCEYMDGKLKAERDKVCPTSVLLQPLDALLYLGCTPPQAQHFAFDGMVAGRLFPHRFYPRTNFGDSVNHLLLNTTRGSGLLVGGSGQVFESTIALIVTADTNSESQVRESLTASGFSPNAINLLPVPRQVSPSPSSEESSGDVGELRLLRTLGGSAWWQAKPDAVKIQMSAHGFHDAAAGVEYVKQLWPVLLLRKNIPVSDSKKNSKDASFALKLENIRNTDVEVQVPSVRMTKALLELKGEVIRTLKSQRQVLVAEHLLVAETEWDRQLDLDKFESSAVRFPTRDATYFLPKTNNKLAWFPVEGHTFVLYGVQNVGAGLASFETVTCTSQLDTIPSPISIVRTDLELKATAERYSSAAQNGLYVMRFSRDCPAKEEESCIQLQEEQFAVGQNVTWSNRLVADPSTGKAPSSPQLMSPVLLIFKEEERTMGPRKSMMRSRL
eukprot:CAMPEP_0196575090 /NCGR_PEP_ID=MMETSP1081-20130531/4656_1 /TAXON_ID=36882 /ORGANISM="Pyramimonas amylifera, Strain CCMP720" /LENGTH=552 /DNA_ID=CAMNT_0041893291 /DNA_START=210 /DNA_END=1868 /DNA_ORIENTATION=+